MTYLAIAITILTLQALWRGRKQRRFFREARLEAIQRERRSKAWLRERARLIAAGQY